MQRTKESSITVNQSGAKHSTEDRETCSKTEMQST